MDAKSHILLNKGKIKIKVDKRIPPEKCSKAPTMDIGKAMLLAWRMAKITFPLMDYLESKGLSTVEIEEVNGKIWGLARKKGISWKELPKHLPSLIKEVTTMCSSAGVRSALMLYLKDLKSGKLKI